MSSQRCACRPMAAVISGSALASASSVASENTTPKPNVSSGWLRSSTVTSCRGSACFKSEAKNRPPGPPPKQVTFTDAPPASTPFGKNLVAGASSLAFLEQQPRDHQVLHLARALVDAERAHRAVEPVDRARGEHALAAQDLHRVVHDALRRLGGVELRHGRLQIGRASCRERV